MTAGEAVPQSLTCPSDSASWWRQLGAVRAVDRVGGPQVSGGTVFSRVDTQVKLGLPGDSLSRGVSAPRTHDVHTAPSCRPRSGARTCGVWQGQHQLVVEPPWQGHGSGSVRCPYFHLGGCVGRLGVSFQEEGALGLAFIVVAWGAVTSCFLQGGSRPLLPSLCQTLAVLRWSSLQLDSGVWPGSAWWCLHCDGRHYRGHSTHRAAEGPGQRVECRLSRNPGST